jgi:DNA-binding MarR family transcriptional regulator
MGATVAALEADGMIDRAPDPQDGRRAVLSLSHTGRELLRDRRDAKTEQIARALSNAFTPEELELLSAAAPLLERLAQNI